LSKGEDNVELKSASSVLEEQTEPPSSTDELLDGTGGVCSSPSNEADIEEEEADEVDHEEEQDGSTEEMDSHEMGKHNLLGVGDDKKSASTDHTNLRYEAPREGVVKDEREPASHQFLEEGLLQALQASQ
jgi:hypothetical protein